MPTIWFLRDARNHPGRPVRLRPVLQAARIFPQSGRDFAPLGRRHVVPRRRHRGQPRHLLHGTPAQARLAALHDYVACCVPFGLFLGRLANFVNGELWGGPTGLAWAIRFPETINGFVRLGPPRPPSTKWRAPGSSLKGDAAGDIIVDAQPIELLPPCHVEDAEADADDAAVERHAAIPEPQNSAGLWKYSSGCKTGHSRAGRPG